MKKITPLLLVLMLMASILSSAFAVQADDNHQGNSDDENESQDQVNETECSHHYDNETEHEIRVMNDSLGARIRLLQLEKALILNILKGNMTVQVLKGFDVNTTKLETILENLTDILDAVRAADPDANDSVQVFVQLKNESRNFTKQFRDTLRLLLDNETIARIKEQLRNITNDELQDCKMRIRHWVREFNRNQLYRLFGLVGEVNTSLLEKYLNGNISLDQVRFHLHKLVNQMTKEKRYMIFSEVKEENIKSKIHAHETMNNIEHHGKGKGHEGRP
jgi:hypothetical protein